MMLNLIIICSQIAFMFAFMYVDTTAVSADGNAAVGHGRPKSTTGMTSFMLY